MFFDKREKLENKNLFLIAISVNFPLFLIAYHLIVLFISTSLWFFVSLFRNLILLKSISSSQLVLVWDFNKSLIFFNFFSTFFFFLTVFNFQTWQSFLRCQLKQSQNINFMISTQRRLMINLKCHFLNVRHTRIFSRLKFKKIIVS